MSKAHHIFYIPGINDPHPVEKQLLLGIWIFYGFKVHYTPMNWSDTRAFDVKLQDLLQQIDIQIEKGNLVSLIGSSAGASAAINAYAQRTSSIQKVICICGKLRNPQTIENTFRIHPSFKESLMVLPHNLKKLNQSDRLKILSVHPLTDTIVPVKDTCIEGAYEDNLPVNGHALGIIYAITLGSRKLAKFLKI